MLPLADKTQIVRQVCEALASGDTLKASAIARKDYPFAPQTRGKRSFSALAATSIFLRDGFIDRYAGTELVYPGALRLLSRLLPAEFPAHPNWKSSESHIIYYELFPTVDHIRPIARGGTNTPDNWATTSMILNSAKANWTLEELHWTLRPPARRSCHLGRYAALVSGVYCALAGAHRRQLHQDMAFRGHTGDQERSGK